MRQTEALLGLYILLIIMAFFRKKHVIYVHIMGWVIVLYNLKEISIFFSIQWITVIMPILGVIGYILHFMWLNDCKTGKTLIRAFHYNSKISINGWAVIYAASYEELFWRGLCIIYKLNYFVTICSCILFSFFHITKKNSIKEYIFLFFWALSLTAIMDWTSSIINCIIIHIVHNICAVYVSKNLSSEE